MPFNNLSDVEAERLALMAEECAAVVQIIGKILRHGYASRHPDTGQRNRELLERELGDVQAASALMHNAGDIRAGVVAIFGTEKLLEVRKYLHHQD
jgi:hypothetical protein